MATALEVFINQVLNQLAATSSVPTDLWQWINKRPQHAFEPGVEEQFDVLLKVLSGHSLKEDPALWGTFMNLKTARNKFVHGGEPIVGGQSLSHEKAADLLSKANGIFDIVRGWMPHALRWHEPETEVINVSTTFRILEMNAQTSTASAPSAPN